MLNQEEYDSFGNILTRSVAKFERTMQARLHAHIFLQFSHQLTMFSVKKLLKDEKISFPPGVLLRGTSQDAENYIHHNSNKGKYCQCNFFKLDELGKCKLCNNKCCKERRTEQLDKLDSGPFIFGKHRFMVGSLDEVIDKINNARLDDINRKTKLRDESISYYQAIQNPEDIPLSWYDNPRSHKLITKDRELLKNNIKFIYHKKHYPKNFLFYARDNRYINEYYNQECTYTQEFKFDSWDVEDFLKLTEKDRCSISRKKLPPVNVVAKFNVITSQDSFVTTFNRRISFEKLKAIYRRFSKSKSYTHGYIINLKGDFHDGRVKFIIETIKEYQSGDIQLFINGGIICDINYEKNSFWVYNEYWETDLPDNIIIPKNINVLHKKLQEKIKIHPKYQS
ncbi:23016_t:CDS:2, partial [Cetraspora pellucida]